jgi:hypothetical protein
MSYFTECLGNILGVRANLKLKAACKENENIFNILRNEYKWQKVRNKFIKDEPCCQICAITKDLQVHHIKPWHLAKELRYDKDNLITLCQSCHFRLGHWCNWKGYNIMIRHLVNYISLMRNCI